MELCGGKIGGKYALGPKIGSGSFVEVYLVNNYGTKEIYALKKVKGYAPSKSKGQKFAADWGDKDPKALGRGGVYKGALAGHIAQV